MNDDHERVRILARILRTITNPQLSKDQRITFAIQMYGAAVLVADKYHISVELVLDIVEKFEDSNYPFYEEPDTKQSPDETVFWDYVNEVDMFYPERRQ